MPKPKNHKEPIVQKLLEKDDDVEEYAVITKKLGNGRFSLKMNASDKIIIGRLCGKMKYRKNKGTNWVDVGSVVLVGMRDFDDKVVDIVHVYDAGEVSQLKKQGKYIETATITNHEVVQENEEDCAFDFNDI
jgi:translation initiation factor 1A